MSSPPPPTEDLPALYRTVLDGVGELERIGRRHAAASIRRTAIAAYSAAWDDRHRQILAGLVTRVRRELERGEPRSEHAARHEFGLQDNRSMVGSPEP